MKVDSTVGDEDDFVSEAIVLLGFKHPKLLGIIGVCFEKKPWLLVTSYMQYKDLGVVMETMTSLKVYCTSSELLSLSVQVAELGL